MDSSTKIYYILTILWFVILNSEWNDVWKWTVMCACLFIYFYVYVHDFDQKGYSDVYKPGILLIGNIIVELVIGTLVFKWVIF